IATRPRAVHWPWTGTDDAHIVGAVRGEAYFDPETDEGLLEIEGLVPNDPTVEQYQLWIFDRTRDERFPVDGGVFDVCGQGRAVIPVQAKLRVGEPVLFAVTVEPSGGSVVSERRIALVARPAERR
ncbi:MAG: anti-sigma factor domain-containing protein, partial [Planctomycetota bacterium]